VDAGERADLLDVVAAGDALALWEWLRARGIAHIDLKDY